MTEFELYFDFMILYNAQFYCLILIVGSLFTIF